jgi:hypothetical protein
VHCDEAMWVNDIANRCKGRVLIGEVARCYQGWGSEPRGDGRGRLPRRVSAAFRLLVGFHVPMRAGMQDPGCANLAARERLPYFEYCPQAP